MHLHSRIKTIALVLLMSSTVHGVQVFTLNDTNDYVFKESGDHILENAMYLYHHYYQRTCDLKLIDFTLVPLYKYYQVFDPIADQSDLDKKVSNNFYGGFAQAVLNLGDLWVRTDTLFGSINERFKNKDPLYKDTVSERSFTKFDDITIRAGYDIFFNGDDHWGPYILGSIPVNHEIEGQLQGSLKTNWKDILKALPQPQPNQNGQPVQAVINDVPFVDILNTEKELTLLIDTPQMGVGNYRVGGGIQGAWTVFDRNEHHIALFGDLQYSYAMSTSLAHLAYNDMILVDEDPKVTDKALLAIKTALKNSKGLVRLNNPKDATEIKYTAGSLINMLGIMHYACGDFNLECGCLLSAGFGQKLQRSYRVITDDVNYPDGGAKKQQPKSETKVATLTDDKNGIVSFTVDEQTFKLKNQPEIVAFRIQPYVAIGINTLISDNPFTVGAGISYEYDRISGKNKPNALQGLSAWTTVSLSF